MGLPIKLETRTGDTPPSRRARQRILPPDILLTTPEQIALMLSHNGAAELFGTPQFVILDELHALASSKRGDLLALDLARLAHAVARTSRAIGLSATVARPFELAAFLVPHRGPAAHTRLAEIVVAGEGARGRHRHSQIGCRAALGRALGALRAARDLRGDQGRTACR